MVPSEDYLEFIIKASNILASSLDYDATLASVANLATSFICDICIVDLIEKNGSIRHVAVVEKHHQKTALSQKILHSPPNPKAEYGIYAVVRSGKPLLISPVTKEWILNVAKNEEDIHIYHEMNLQAQMFLPLISRGKTVGVLWLASRDPNRLYNKKDLIWAQELAKRAAVAVDNARLYKEAQDAVRARDEFLSIASHELKTPLTSIMLQLQVALHKLRTSETKSIDENVSKLLENAQQQSKRLRRLINDLLNISLITTGRLQLEKEVVNFSRLVKQVIARFTPQLEATDYKLKTDIEERVLVALDRVRAEQVVTNLISNAMKYGDGKLITIRVKQTEHHAVFIIKDRGIGIDPKKQEAVFERFSRGVKEHQYRGLGIGLYICRQIVAAHAGTIHLKSEQGKGTTFTIKFPL